MHTYEVKSHSKTCFKCKLTKVLLGGIVCPCRSRTVSHFLALLKSKLKVHSCTTAAGATWTSPR